ncbi:TIGR00266 family protein [Leifsonia poae]|uniref:TIGR00266 family protein n=1 Tax=Leifsonia poae TaxID=110933 RepID=UPI003D68CB60
MSDFTVLPNVGHAGAFSFQVDYRPAFSMATLSIGAGQTVATQAGAMVSMSPGLELTSQLDGGVMGALKRSVAGRSAFVSRFTARNGVGELTLAPAAPGDLVPLHLDSGTYNIAAASYLASEPTLDIDTTWGGMSGFFGSDSLFVMRVSGQGVLLLTAFGSLHEKRLAPGEKYIIDTGHVVAWDSSMDVRIQKATKSLFRSFTSGEMLVAEFTGPGTVLMQTRNLGAFVGAMGPFMAGAGGGGATAGMVGAGVAGGVLGGLLS